MEKIMQVALEIPTSRIANMMCSAIESGDPVTTARKGGWCNGIYLKGGEKAVKQFEKDGPWYCDEKLYSDPRCVLRIKEVVDEATGKEKTHTVSLSDMARGLNVMAEKFPHVFAQILEDNTDAPCADIFLQCILFGDEKYA
jgi:hypothetical protein